MKEIKTVSRENFDKADATKTRRGYIQIDKDTVYGFFVNDFFFFTESRKYYRVAV